MNLKQKLSKRKLSVGSWISLAHPAIAEIMVAAGFDWIAVDLEHSVITIREAEELIRVIALGGGTPLVRLTSNDPNQIKRVMDAGAHGIIVPMVRTAAQARAAADSVYYPTRGTRGIGLARAQGYGAGFQEYLGWLEKNAVIIAQIEHIDAVRDLEAILTVPEIDGFLVGPYDLSGSMGIPGQFSHPEFLEAQERIFTIAGKLGKPGGLHIVEPDTRRLQASIQEGHRLIAYSVDTRILDVACRSGLMSIATQRESL